MSDKPSQPVPNPPAVPAAQPSVPGDPSGKEKAADRPAPDPTRYGDWEKNGRCIDF